MNSCLLPTVVGQFSVDEGIVFVHVKPCSRIVKTAVCSK